tara:strand:+ start:4955 stop:5314 length:360 start_codon:yes stop_codon:yes gene_type:complete
MPGIVSFINSNNRYIVPTTNISLIKVASTTSVVVYLSNGSINPQSHQETNRHSTKALYNESIVLTTTANYSVYIAEQLGKLIGNLNSYAEVEVDGVDYADFNEITAVAYATPTEYDYDA